MAEVAHKIELDFTTLEFFSKYVISNLKEDRSVEKEEANTLSKICTDYYGTKRFVYISHRINKCNVDPTVYISNMPKEGQLRGIAVVAANTPAIKSAKFERLFATFEFEIFTELDDAIEWAQELMEE
ncbi:hypothetical protein [Autumnicola psychrophila]|uniref:STAS/SEC14 domain-containing protein n=1 Tax=Autumnicola psychrophila TaxID=3075592 RepID=A0ABU3DVR3_9FLAO|nr:hypothetical protein [Zunongwangia sp. F225]MDT0687802.1 hypothetical protein [Zunongwangia sp. F225]